MSSWWNITLIITIGSAVLLLLHDHHHQYKYCDHSHSPDHCDHNRQHRYHYHLSSYFGSRPPWSTAQKFRKTNSKISKSKLEVSSGLRLSHPFQHYQHRNLSGIRVNMDHSCKHHLKVYKVMASFLELSSNPGPSKLHLPRYLGRPKMGGLGLWMSIEPSDNSGPLMLPGRLENYGSVSQRLMMLISGLHIGGWNIL